MHYILDIEIATQYDVNVSLFLQNIAFWTKTNIANEQNYYDGYFWTYNTIKAFSELFPFWTVSQIRTTIQRCINEGLLIKGKYNKTRYDQTLWYALTEKGLKLFKLPICQKSQMKLSEVTNEVVRNSKPIPDINTDITTDIKNSCPSKDERVDTPDNFDYFWSIYPKKQKKQDARKSWIKKKCEEHLVKIIEDINYRVNNQWKGIAKNYIPNPDVYLNGARWEDERLANSKKPISMNQKGDVMEAIRIAQSYSTNNHGR